MSLPNWHNGAADWSQVEWENGTCTLALEFEGSTDEVRVLLQLN